MSAKIIAELADRIAKLEQHNANHCRGCAETRRSDAESRIFREQAEQRARERDERRALAATMPHVDVSSSSGIVNIEIGPGRRLAIDPKGRDGLTFYRYAVDAWTALVEGNREINAAVASGQLVVNSTDPDEVYRDLESGRLRPRVAIAEASLT